MVQTVVPADSNALQPPGNFHGIDHAPVEVSQEYQSLREQFLSPVRKKVGEYIGPLLLRASFEAGDTYEATLDAVVPPQHQTSTENLEESAKVHSEVAKATQEWRQIKRPPKHEEDLRPTTLVQKSQERINRRRKRKENAARSELNRLRMLHGEDVGTEAQSDRVKAERLRWSERKMELHAGKLYRKQQRKLTRFASKIHRATEGEDIPQKFIEGRLRRRERNQALRGGVTEYPHPLQGGPMSPPLEALPSRPQWVTEGEDDRPLPLLYDPHFAESQKGKNKKEKKRKQSQGGKRPNVKTVIRVWRDPKTGKRHRERFEIR